MTALACQYSISTSRTSADSNASKDKFDVSRDIDLAAPILRDMLSDHAMPTVRCDAALPPKAVANGELNTKEMGPVKWQVKF
jgi:hypothetical protein